MNSNDQNFTHVREGQPTMVDITGKSANRRTAVAEARMELGAEIIARFQNNDLQGPKGPVFQTAIIAGTMAVKKTSELIPFCHPLPVENCEFKIIPNETGVAIRCEVSTTGKTGVEMEALTAVQIALLTIYDMCKAVDRAMSISDIHLVEKKGGKSGHFKWKSTPASAR